jgi:hypothetical protein
MILNIFSELISNFNSNINNEFYNAIPLDFIFIFIILIFVLASFLLISVVLVPLFRASPSRLYEKYLFLREELERIDQLYAQKKILFDEYVSMQLLNAQEYYSIIKTLSKHPEYKSKLKGYSLKNNDVDSNKTEVKKPRKLSKEEITEKQINKLCEVLKPKVNNYSKEDVYSVLLYEGFDEYIINSVLRKLLNLGVTFAEHSTSNKKDLSLFLNNLFDGGESSRDLNTSEKILLNNNQTNDFFKDDSKRKELDFDKISDVDYTFKAPVEEEKPSFFKRLFSFKKKKEKPTITEIDKVLKNIESELKNKEI